MTGELMSLKISRAKEIVDIISILDSRLLVLIKLPTPFLFL
jgi:hypothetical protein